MKTRLVVWRANTAGMAHPRQARPHAWPTVVLADWSTVVCSIKIRLRSHGFKVLIIPRLWFDGEYGIQKSKQSNRK